MRSCTAETIYKSEGYATKSAGTSKTATTTISDELISWADLIFVMEENQKVIMTKYFRESASDKKIIVLGIPDDYYYMDEELIDLIKERVSLHLR
jgi:predicted protein tyrosine phosphatase